MGLIQREIERAGIPTISVSIVRKLTEEVKAPRAVFLRWPMGHPLGEPGRVDQQTVVVKRALEALEKIKEPGTIVDLPYRWRRYDDIRKDVVIT
ncbi:MAG: hypothetical protein V3W31_09425 [Thermodesulfobacteriota bacterium]